MNTEKTNDYDYESQTPTEEPQGCQCEQRRRLSEWRPLFVRTGTLQVRALQLQVTGVKGIGEAQSRLGEMPGRACVT